MSNTDFLRQSELQLLPDGFVQGRVFEFKVNDYVGRAEVDGWNPQAQEAIEICQSETLDTHPKPGQKRKLASDAFKLVFLKQLNLIKRGRIFVTSPELYTWFHQTGSWLSAACRNNSISVELHRQQNKRIRKKIRNVMQQARKKG